MADLADHASELEEQQRSDAIARSRLFNGCPSSLLTVRCIECSVKIPTKRVQAVPGTKRCADCQEVFEMLQRSKGRNG